ncbi:MAG: DUF5677 domain-containing protein [Brevundimonas sp.]|uniref:DUF5677 domain-containing protein n=1 Tax=Brevundimonas sp. TaxID=1871086 RepID=UPI00391CF969
MAGVINLLKVQDAAMAALPVIRDEAARLIDCAAPDEPCLGTVRRLINYQSQRGQAALYLATSGMPWDAEIVLRAYYEATARILILCLGEPEERAARLKEYWDVLGGIGERRRAVKAENLKDRPGRDARSAALIDVFRDQELFSTEPQADKKSRKAVEQRWSFSELIAHLSKPRNDIAGLPQLADYLHCYGMASHLLHADPTALDLMHDRATRPHGEARLLEASQLCRIFTDVVGLSYFCADAIRVMLSAEFFDADLLHGHVRHSVDVAQPIFEAFYDSQAEFYRAHGRSEF